VFVSKQSLLLVDGDTRSLRVLEVSLRKAGFVVTAAASVQDALDKLELHVPDLIISETTFPEGDGFELRRRVRATPEWSEIPFIFLTAEAAIENKIRGLELGVDDYLTKPIYIKEIVTRINILLQKRQRVRFEERRDGRTRFAGRVQDMPVVDVIQTIEISRKSGVIQFIGERGRQAAIYFRDGRVIDAEAGALQGEDAVYRLLTWSEGEFEVVFRTVRRREVITVSSQGLLMEGMRRLDEWSRLFEQLPPLTHRFEVDTIELAARLGDVPDDNNRILRLFDGKRTLLEVIDASDVRDLECLQAISRLYFEELLLDLDHGKVPRRDTGKSIPLVEVDAPTPIQEVASGPTSFESAVSDGALEASTGGAGEVASGASSFESAVSDGAREASTGGAGEVASGGTSDDASGGALAPVDDDNREANGEGIGPLMGGYRQSSLRLIDEAVAAAQAIEPSLFDDLAAAQGGNGVSSSGPPNEAGAASSSASKSSRLTAPGREESGLRMIGSLGRDRAEASGELAALGEASSLRNETARELVTILPRRNTREMPALTQELAASLTPSPVLASPVLASPVLASPVLASPVLASPVLASPVLASKPITAPAVEAPTGPPPPPRVSLPGSGVSAPTWSRRLLRIARSVNGRRPGLGALLVLLLAALLAGSAVFLRLRRHASPAQGVESIQDAAQLGTMSTTLGASVPGPGAMASLDATAAAGRSHDAAAHDAGLPGVDAGPPGVDAGLPGVDAGLPGVDAGPPGVDAGSASGGVDKVTEAKALYDKAEDALAAGAVARALELVDGSLRLRKTVRTYLLRAQAMQRLERVEEALAAVDAAAQLAPEHSAVWWRRGWILWAARRYDEARPAFERFLQLEPDGPKAASVRRLLNEPR
jgi:CheY-like chemotaxis protein